MFFARSALLVMVATAPAALSAQDSTVADSTPFRRGQWAAQFGAGFNFSGLGALLFTSPTRAWLLDARLEAGHTNDRFTVSTATGDTTITDFNSSGSVIVRVGTRAYAPNGRQLVTFHTLGVSGGFLHGAGGRSSGGGSESNGWNAGVFGELGASYLFAPRLSIGGVAGVAFTYARAAGRSSSGNYRFRDWSYRFSTSGVAFVATLYF